MIEKILKLKCKGGFFLEETTIPFFKNNEERISIIYGKNGSGKSTISKAVMKASGYSIGEVNTASFLTNDDNIVSLPEEKCVYVFNEQYIIDNVRIKEDGLDTIVMLGEQVGIDNQLRKLGEKKAILKEEEKIINEAYAKYENAESKDSPQYYMDKMRKALSGEKNWADRYRLIKSSKRNASVSADTCISIGNNKPKETFDELKSLYESKYSQLKLVKFDGEKITEPVKIDNLKSIDEEKIINLLSEKIEKPMLTEREEYLLSLLSNDNSTRLYEMKEKFSDENTNRCPFCYQTVSDEYREGLIESISKILSRIVEEHKSSLEKIRIKNACFNSNLFEVIDKGEVSLITSKVELLNNKIDEVNKLIQKKIDNPYEEVEILEIGINDYIEELIIDVEKIERKRVKYNKQFDNIDMLINELLKLNDKIAYYEIIEYYESYIIQKKKLNEEKEKKVKIENDLSEINNQISKLEDKKKSVHIAVEILNSSLRYVFFSKDRIEIECENNTYKLMSNGHSVKPADISIGERNILALCYFFTEILQKKEKSKAYSNEMFIVIDDPISSFDHENKVGILSLIKEKISIIVSANLNSKIVILSHDVQSIFDLNKMCSEIQKSFRVKDKNINFKYISRELKEKQLSDFKYKKRNEYTEMIKKVYDFALNGAEEDEISIGNIMRRALESFSTFFYKMGIEEISYRTEILDLLNEECYKNYFENLMYRLVLNSESHMEERVRGISDVEFCEMYTKDEKQRTARDIMVFLYLINPLHIETHLQDVTDCIRNIKEWRENIKNIDM